MLRIPPIDFTPSNDGVRESLRERPQMIFRLLCLWYVVLMGLGAGFYYWPNQSALLLGSAFDASDSRGSQRWPVNLSALVN